MQLLGLLLGLVIGVFLTFPFMLAQVEILGGLHKVLPSLQSEGGHAALELLLSSIVFYAVWLVALMPIIRRAGRVSAFMVFLIVLPLPPMVFEQYLVHSPLQTGGVH
jgi:hypothetical protein